MDIPLIMLIVWLSIFLMALLVEIFTEALVSVWFCIGALITFGLSFIPGLPWWAQVIIFIVLSTLAFIGLRPIAAKMLRRTKSDTNIDAIIHQKGLVTKGIAPLNPGEVKVGAIYWTAIAQEETSSIPEGETIEVVAVDGNKLVVRKTILKEEK